MPGAANGGASQERRVNASVFLARLTVADGAWLNQVLPTLQRGVRARADAVRVEDVVLRHRPGRLGIADALDATAELLRPLSVAGATLEHRSEWYIANDDDDDDDTDELPVARRLADLIKSSDDDLLVNARVVVDAAADDAGAAAIYWAILALSNS